MVDLVQAAPTTGAKTIAAMMTAGMTTAVRKGVVLVAHRLADRMVLVRENMVLVRENMVLVESMVQEWVALAVALTPTGELLILNGN